MGSGELNLGLCGNLEGWDMVEGGKEIQDGGDVCIPMAGLCCFLPYVNINQP